MSRPGTNYLERNCHHTGPGGLPIGAGGVIVPGGVPLGPGGGPLRPGLGPGGILAGRPLPGDPPGTIFSRAGQPDLVGVASKTSHL